MAKILELDITLKRSKPKIWRRVHIPADLNFYELHYVVQFAMGWRNSHLHQFDPGVNGILIQLPFEDDDWEESIDSRVTGISEYLAAPKDKITYEYDFGDGWEHLIEVKKVLEAAPGQKYPVLVGGARACPPEDCGGIWGYDELCETIKKPDTEAYEEMLEWLGEEFDPEEFDMAEINRVHFKNFKKNMKDWGELFG